MGLITGMRDGKNDNKNSVKIGTNNKGKIQQILTYPDPVLLRSSEPVVFPLTQTDKELIADMWATVNGKGVGLAAPQIGHNKQILIIKLSEDFSARDLRKMGLNKKADFLMINPAITWYSELESLMVEGCLSFPEQYYEIWRPANVKIEFYDEAGKKQTMVGKDWFSRVVQHELDHLQGKVFIDKGGRKIKDEVELETRRVVD